MTYILGWKNSTSVFLTGDSALTTLTTKPDKSFSTFGEQHVFRDGGLVEEKMLKLCSIKNKVIVALAGDRDMALSIVTVFKDTIDQLDVLEAFRRSTLSCGPYTKGNEVSLILGYIEDGKPRLISFRSPNKIIEHPDFVSAGSLGSFYPFVTEKVVKLFLKGMLSDEHMLSAVTSVLQSYSIFDDLMRMNVGGVFFGLSINNVGVHWQEDTSYILYSFQPSSFGFITAVFRDGAVCVNSSLTDDNRVFANSINCSIEGAFGDKWKVELREFFNSGKSKFYVFLSKKERVITVVKTNNKLETNLLKIKVNTQGHFDFCFSHELMTVLMSPLLAKDNALPFRFNWRNAE